MGVTTYLKKRNLHIIIVGYHYYLPLKTTVMKKALLIMFAVFCGYSAYCQSKDVFIYDETGIGYGTHFSFQTAINCIFNNDQVAALGFYRNSRLAPDAPSDYHTGVLTGLPRQRLNMLGFMYGKVLYARNYKLRYVLKGGLAIGDATTPANFQPAGNGAIWYFGPNYTYSNNTVFNYGVVINPISSSAGLEANVIFGRLRDKKVME